MGRETCVPLRLLAIEQEASYDVLLVHHNKAQTLATLPPARLRAALVWAEGPFAVAVVDALVPLARNGAR
jgi:hypothetical protein